jgi:hypothetical protein
MKANPGGQLQISEILGREQLIEDLWEVLERQSILITAERRIGKTSVIRKMCAEPPAEWVPVLQDLERVHTGGRDPQRGPGFRNRRPESITRLVEAASA